jgi:hypothetical protein
MKAEEPKWSRPAERISEEELVEIRIRPDGTILFHGTSEEFLEIAAQVCPNDPWLKNRVRVMEAVRRSTRESDQRLTTETVKETTHGPA